MIGTATGSDAASLAELWREAGLRFHPELTERELASVLGSELVLVDEEAGRITGTVFGSYDGLRGWVRRLAIRPDRRGRGIATALLAELERRLLATGCPKVNLLIEPADAGVASFYARLGYRRDDLLFMEKWLAPEPGPSLFIPNESGRSPAVPSPAAGGWRDIKQAHDHLFVAWDQGHRALTLLRDL